VREWQADVYRRPLQDDAGNALWELVICERDRALLIAACPQPYLNAAWLTGQLTTAMNLHGKPDRLLVFRPQSLSLLEAAAEALGILVQGSRHTPELKALLQYRADDYPTLPNYTGQPYNPIALDRPPPVPLSDALWGDRWRFAAIPSGDFMLAFAEKPIPIRSIPDRVLPQQIGLASTTPIPGVIIDGGRTSMRLARWIQDQDPVAVQYIPGAPDGLIMDAGLVDRWILTTFNDADVSAAGQTYQHRLVDSQGLHFLLIQPDDSGITYTALWLLRSPIDSPT
jgi:hypothetical protein